MQFKYFQFYYWSVKGVNQYEKALLVYQLHSLYFLHVSMVVSIYFVIYSSSFLVPQKEFYVQFSHVRTGVVQT